MTTMSVRTLTEILGRLDPDASVTVAINGCLFDVAAVTSDGPSDTSAPRVLLQLGNAYDYRFRLSQDCS